jgi:hypothetical protein
MPEFARINATSDGDNTVITGAAGQKIVVLGYSINVNAAGVVTWQDSAVSPVIFASYEFVDGGGASYAGTADAPAFEVTEGLNLELSTAAGVDGLGHITFERKTRAR